MTIQRLDHLLHLAGNNQLSEREMQELTVWYRSFSGEDGLTGDLSAEQRVQLEKLMWSRIHAAITQVDHSAAPSSATLSQSVPVQDLPPPGQSLPGLKVKRLTLWWSAAAAVIILLAAGGYSYFRLQIHRDSIANIPQRIAHDAVPGGNRATLTLGDGSVIELDSARNGVLNNTAGVSIVKQASGQLIYRPDSGPRSANAGNTGATETVYNSISTPKGGQYEIVLPDGTTVWMNAATTMRYPNKFTGSERAVELSGEAYFEVAKDAGKPFIVHTRDMNIQVLGTHFNVMAYDGEMRQVATLLEGSVKVSHGPRQEMLRPGQQAAITEKEGQIRVSDAADIGEVIAWKNGLFQFNDVDLPTILRQAARWYDIDVVYAGQIPTDLFRGKISRNVQLSKLLKILELNGIQFTIEGKTLTVH